VFIEVVFTLSSGILITFAEVLQYHKPPSSLTRVSLIPKNESFEVKLCFANPILFCQYPLEQLHL